MTARPDCLLLSYMAWDTSTANQSVQTAFAPFAACCAHLNVLLVNVNFNIKFNVEPGQCNFLPLPSTVPMCQTGHLTNQPQHTDARFNFRAACFAVLLHMLHTCKRHASTDDREYLYLQPSRVIINDFCFPWSLPLDQYLETNPLD